MSAVVADATAKLQLDEETGDMVSKKELKKRLQKRAKKAATQARKQDQSPTPGPVSGTAQAENKDGTMKDPEAMFKQGFLAEVFREHPSDNVLTRFPPEPNGYLHLGHAKAIAVNFGFARFHGGKTILRFDDTNPDKEKEEFFLAILEAIRWLGFTPIDVTYSSDNFQRLYEKAEKLIELSKAYVCHCTDSQIKLQRGGEDGKAGPRFRCEHAEQDIGTNLAKFRDMRDGKYEPQAAFLRMKQDIGSNNPQMWDLAAYRIPKHQTPHFRTGNEWRIYPTYDFTHCLCDSFEGITHSLCTTEFVLSRESYEWLNRTLGAYEPMQREYGRLNGTNTVMSKRALEELINCGTVRGWDDPRLYTLSALRRRGVPPGAILSFINELGVTTAKSVIQIARFEQSIRRHLELDVPRLMLVLDPVRVVIENLEDLEEREVEVPFLAKRPEMGSRKVTLTRTLYIDRSDFRETDSPGYYRLSPNKNVGLLNIPHPIQAVSFSKDSNGKVEEIHAKLDREGTEKPKAFIQWVPEGSLNVEVRVQGRLFRSEEPSSVEGGFLNDIDPNSEMIYGESMIERGFDEIRRTAPWPKTQVDNDPGPEDVRFQGLRVAYFAMDTDSTDDKIVFNRVVSLKGEAAKS